VSTEPGTEVTDATPWDGLEEVCDIVTRVFLKGAQIQLLTEWEATTRLLRETQKRQPGALGELFSHLSKGKYYEKTVTWMAFSYTCAYVAKLESLKTTKSGAPEKLTDAEQIRVATLEDVVAKRQKLRIQYFDEENPGVLFAGADKPLKDLVKVEVTKGVAKPPAATVHEWVDSKLGGLSKLLQKTTWEDITEEEWLKRCGKKYQLLRIDLSGLDLGQGEPMKPVLEAEALLDPGLTQKTVKLGRIILGDRTSRLQKTGNSIEQIVNLRYGLDGNKCEYDTAKMATSLAGDAHWQDKDADWRLGTGENRKTYYSQVHPKIAQYVLSLLPGTPTPDSVTILDIAGGNGDLAERIIKEMAAQKGPRKRLTYILVDFSKADVALAKRRFARMSLPSGFRVKRVTLARDMLSYRYNAAKARKDFGIPDGADIIINSGGLLNNQIGNDKQTPLRFNKMYGQMLKPGGYGVYSGLTPLLVNAKMHRDHGLRVINLYDPEAQRQMHVVQRPK
jgi:hypothetical protein